MILKSYSHIGRSCNSERFNAIKIQSELAIKQHDLLWEVNMLLDHGDSEEIQQMLATLDLYFAQYKKGK